MIKDADRCVSFILVSDGRILLEKRSITKQSDPGMVTIPGGHVEKGESSRETLFRELEEELAIRPESYQFLCTLYHPARQLELIDYFVVTAWHGEIECHEAESVFWCGMLEKGVVDIECDQTALNELARLADLFV